MSDGSLEIRVDMYLWKIVPPILLILGTVGNIMSITVMSRRNMRGSQASVYLIALSVADIVVLYTGLLRHFLRRVADFDVRSISNFGCKLHITLVYATLHISVWILVAFTFERILSVFIPYKVKLYCTRLSSLLVISSIVVVLFGLNAHFLYGFSLATFPAAGNSTVIACYYVDTDYRRFMRDKWPWVDLCIFSLVPFFILIIGNTCIAVRVLLSRRKTRRVASFEASPTTLATGTTGPRLGMTAPIRTTTKTDRTSSMTFILLLLNMVFLVTTTPISIYLIIAPAWTERAKTDKEKAMIDLTFTIVNLIQYINNSINFILYCITGSRFRKELQYMLFKKQRVRVFPTTGHGNENGGGNRHLNNHRTTATSDVIHTPLPPPFPASINLNETNSQWKEGDTQL